MIVSACASQEDTRTKWTDKGMRVMLDADSVDEQNYIRATTAVVKSDKWTVVDRRNAFEAIKKEADREHRQDEERFENKAKWLQWGKLYGIGSVIVPYTDCWLTRNRFTKNETKHCRLSLTLADSNTAEIIVAVEAEQSCSPSETPDWTEAVEKLADAYPEKFVEHQKSKRIQAYENESEKLAIIQQGKNEIDSGRINR
jgi:hypothetical protein